MKYYRIRKLINGYRIKPSLKGYKLVGVPRKPLQDMVVDTPEGKMVLNRHSKCVHEETFEDKYGRNRTYTLYYYIYKQKQVTDQLQLL